MNRQEIRDIVSRWMFPTAKASYMGGLEDRPVLEKSHGSTVVDTDGKEYLDFQSGQMGAALGHQHPRIVARITETMKSLLHATNTMLNVERLKLHETLGRLLPPPLQKSVFLVSGSDSIEAAVDLARKATGGLDVIGMHAGLHGSTSYLTRSLSFNWTRRKHSIVAPATSAILTPYCYRCPLKLTFPKCEIQCLKTSMELADANFTADPAAFIGEPILSAGGVIVPPPGFYPAMREECDKRGMLMIFDESQTGLGKTGKLFGFQHEPVQPDIITLSKHFGGGLPISTVCTSAEIAEKAVANGYFATRSHATDPLLCAAGEESLRIVVEEDMAGRAARIEQRIRAALAAMEGEIELIGDVRGRGVLLGIELVTDRVKKTPANAETAAVARYCLDKGLIFQIRGTGPTLNVLRLVPPMTTTDAEVDRAMSILFDALRAVSVKSRAALRARRRVIRALTEGATMSTAAIPISTRQDRFGNARDPLVGYARGAIIDSELAESLRQQRAYRIIRDRYERLGDAGLFNLTGLIRAFPLGPGDEEPLRSYVHFIARCNGELEAAALARLGAVPGRHDGFLANRVSAAMIAIMLVLLEPGDRVLSVVPADRSHPSIKQAVNLARGNFEEVQGVAGLAEALERGPAPKVVAITTIAPSKHHLPAAEVIRAIALAHAHGARVVLDDAHMASRIAIYEEPPSLALAEPPDVAVWSLDKHMGGPRSGFVSGEAALLRRIKARALALGIEAQPGQYLAGLHAMERFDPAPVKAAATMAARVFATLAPAMAGRGYIAGAGLAVGGEDFVEIVLAKAGRERCALAPIEVVAFASMTILERFGAITIPAVGMPGAACTFRLMMYPDGERFGDEGFVGAWHVAVEAAAAALERPEQIRAVLFGRPDAANT